MSQKAKKDVGTVISKSGVSFRVWAPFADSVEVIGSFGNWSGYSLKNENDGYWYAFVKDAKAGQEYKFVIRNGDNTYYRNDPRALQFITSVGNSIITSQTFDWENDNFTAIPIDKQVIYELHVGTFNRPDPSTIGTFQDVIDKLDYLAELGINMIELMPICSMLMDRGWGYATDYIFAVESLYGGRHNFMRFVKEAHKRGIGIILDVVYNHFGPDEKLDLWQFDGWREDNKGGIYFYNDWRAETPWGNTRPDFGREEVRQYILDNVRMWLKDCRVDGLRVDSTIFIRNAKGYSDSPDTDLPEGWQLMQQINETSRSISPSLITIAEDVAANEYITKPTTEGGAGFSSQWELGFPMVLREALISDDPTKVNLTGICGMLNKRYNDDAFQRIIYTDSHDSAANGSARLNEIIAPGKSGGLYARKQSLIAATLLLTVPGIPMLFQGQEFMESGSFSDWQALDWSKKDQHSGIIDAYKYLIALRKNHYGNSEGLLGKAVNLIHLDETNKVLAYHRWKNNGPKDDVMIIINFCNESFPEYELNFPRDGAWSIRFNSVWKGYSSDFNGTEVNDVFAKSGSGLIMLPPNSAIILSQDK